MEKEINGIVYEQIATSKGCSDCDLQNNFVCHDLDCNRVVWKKKTNEWQELDINNIPSDIFKNWEIERTDMKYHRGDLILEKAICKEGSYRIRPKQKTLEEKAEEYARSVVNKYNICGGTGLYWLNEISMAYIAGDKSRE